MNPRRIHAGWLYGFIVFQFVCQTALLVSGTGPLRTILRVVVFAPSLILLVIPGPGRSHPSAWLVRTVLGVTALGMFHPGLNSPAAGVAYLALTLAVWAPIFWVPRVAVDPGDLLRVVVLIWAYSTASATVGVLQTYYPTVFAPDPEFVRQTAGAYAEGLRITLDDGTSVFRPSGLSDTPGGAALSGMFAVVTGLAVFGAARNPLLRLAALPAAMVGVFCLLICQVRSLVILTALSYVGFVVLSVVAGRLVRAATLLVLFGGVLLAGSAWVLSIGSEGVTDRLSTLVDGSASDVYYRNRGIFLEETIHNILPEYPLGAGLGRWGMMNFYFGDSTNLSSPALWAEIQPTAWVYDGGFLLLLAGYAAMLGISWRSLRLAMAARTPEMADLGAVVTALNVGVVFTTFGAHVFVAQSGMQFCLLNAALYAATVGGRRG